MGGCWWKKKKGFSRHTDYTMSALMSKAKMVELGVCVHPSILDSNYKTCKWFAVSMFFAIILLWKLNQHRRKQWEIEIVVIKVPLKCQSLHHFGCYFFSDITIWRHKAYTVSWVWFGLVSKKISPIPCNHCLGKLQPSYSSREP